VDALLLEVIKAIDDFNLGTPKAIQLGDNQLVLLAK